ncbi:ATP-dependent DNA helicase PIF1 [Zea mays]|uniref:ATP-dependent DNA helicase n=1 Tax=Zea mays TaxID=4577 RepID=A0A3L6DQ23_MAIZE|nr:ATP-dependent DNA helicase PIF1 [Zea mays]
MEVPTYTSEVVHPTADVSKPDSSSDNACDWVIPEYTSTPFMPASTQTEDVGSPDMSTKPLRRKHHVLPGERQAILARQNKKFEANIARNVATLTDDTISDVGQMDDSTQPGSTIEINNTVDDDDEGVIFGEANDEIKGYLFADEDTNEDFEIDGTQDQSVVTDVPDPYDTVYSNIPEETHMLKHIPDCGYCTAKKFEGELGWHANIPKVGVSMDEVDAYRATHRASNANDEDAEPPTHLCVFMRDYYCYKFQIRPGVFNPILHGKRLFQQFAVDTYIKIESSRLDFIRKNQDRLRADLYQGLVDSMLDGDVRGEKELKHRLSKQDILGKVRAYVYIVEFQKRGLPHAHFLLIMQRKYKLTCPEQYDLLISAEIPSNRYPELRKMVIKHMMHRPCGSLNPNCPCTKGRASCKNQYPRHFREATMQGKDSYPNYRRRDDGRKEKVRGCELDNRWVVPYNPYLLRLFNCHINVEACGSIKAVKYLFKYIYKGHDRASVVMRDASKENGDVDEIQQYRDARWVTPPEALWRIYGFELSQNSPSVMQLQLHLPNMHMVTFHERQMVERVVNRPGADRSMITTYFEANKLYEEARGILYHDFPEWYTWQQGKVWQRRKQNTGGQVGRIVSALPSEGERFYLRLLLNHVIGATSYVDLRTVDGDTLPSFREAAQRRGLLEVDNTIYECLNEAALYQMPTALRRLFATILVFCEPNDVAELWQRHLDTMSEDYHRITQSKTHLQQMVLIDIRNMLQSMGKDIKTFPLPAIIDRYDDSQGIDREIYEEEIIEATIEDVALQETLNEEQKPAYEKILSVVDTSNGSVFFVDGPGGTGKTYLYKALLAVLRSQDKIAVAIATSGVAASIMPGGRTAHSRFKIPLTIEDGAICTFTKQSGTSKLLQKASLLIWDEASMAKRQSIEALDNSMRDIMGRPDLPFGGKTILFGGDFRQVLPVVHKGSRAQIVAASLRSSYLWESMCHLKLVRNMRAKSDPWFAEYLLRVGSGTEEVNNDGDVCLPDEVCVPYTSDDRDLDRLIDDIYPSLNENMSNTSYITSRAILTTRNDWVDMINMRMIDRFQWEQMMYHSFDTVVDDPNNYYPSEFLNPLTPNGLPPHVLKLKIGCPIMLLRNIDPANGLCNGTRLVVRGFQKNSIDAEIVLGQHAGMHVFLPRIPLCPSDDEIFPLHFKRKQFPGDLALIDWIKEIPCEPRVEVVLIDDAFVERKWMECLFQPDAYLGDEVIDCYINLIKAQEHLKCRSGGHVHIENVFQFNFLKRDGDVETKTDELYPSKDMAQISSAERRVLLYLDHDMVFIPINIREMHWYLAVINARNMEIQVLDSLGTSSGRNDLIDTILDSPTNPKKRKLLCVSEENEVLMEDDDGPITQADLERWFVHDWDKRTPIKIPTDECTNEFLLSGLSTKDMPVTKADLIDVLCDYIMTIQYDTTLEMTWMRSFKPFKIEISVKDLQNVLRVNLDMTLKCFDMAVRLLAIKESHMSKDELIKDKKHYMDMRFWVLMPWKFNGCYALFIIDHGKKHVTFIDFTPTQDWCKHMPYKRFAEAIIMVSKKYKIAYNKKRSGWADDIFKWEHTIRSGLPLDLKGVNTSYFVLQAMVMWGSGRRMEFNRDAKILRRNFVIDLLSYEENLCRYAIPPNIQQRLISIAKKD